MAEKENTPEISVIIPVYNVEKFIGRCLLSLVGQTFRSYEVIAVNDGSTDSSGDILRSFAEKYDFIKVIDQKNAGASKARNAAIRAARGKYFSFVDSDDYVAPTFLEELYYACKDYDADISCCYYYFHYIENDLLLEYPFRCKGVLDRTQAMKKLLHDVQIQSLLWNKLYRRELFTDYNITFPSMCFEDIATLDKIFLHANRVVVLDRPLYYYNQHASSTLATISTEKINDFVQSMAMVRLSLEGNGVYEKYKKSFKAMLNKTCGCCHLYIMQIHAEKKCFRGFLANIRRVDRILRELSEEDFDTSAFVRERPDIVAEPQKLEKDYSVR